MTLHFTIEPFLEAAREAWPLMLEHAAEVGVDRMGAPFQPDWDAFIAADASGSLVSATARDEEQRIVGYAYWFIVPSPLHKDLTIGINQAFYFREDYRKTPGFPWDVIRFLKFCEDALERRGCRLLIFDAWVEEEGSRRKDLQPLMRRSGFAKYKIGYWKTLSESQS